MGSIVRIILQGFIKYALPVAAGIGAGAIMDKVAADKLPAYPAGGITPALIGDGDGKPNFAKIAYILLAVTIGGILVSIVLKKFKIAR